MMVIRRPKNASNFRSPIVKMKNTGHVAGQRDPFSSRLISVVKNIMLLETLILILKPEFIFSFPSGIYLFKVNNANTNLLSEICSRLTIKKPDRCQWRRYVSIVNFEQISRIILVFPSLSLHKWIAAGSFQCFPFFATNQKALKNAQKWRERQ